MKTTTDAHQVIELHLLGVERKQIVKQARSGLETVQREIDLFESGRSKEAIYGSIVKNIMDRNGFKANHCNVCDKEKKAFCHIQVATGATNARIRDLSYICNSCIRNY
jgi:hypothetical protein